MRVPLSWLKSYVALDVQPTDHAAVRGLARDLDDLGLVVEGIDFVGEGLKGVTLARVLAISAIEGADKIRLATIDAGRDSAIEVVCGAWNYGIGDVVPFADIGVTLPNGMEIQRRKMRGVVSNGMLCSARELGLGDNHEGLMVLARTGSAHGDLPGGLVLGDELSDHLGIVADVVFDLSIEPNRPDALSIVGIARDIAARRGAEFTVPDPVVVDTGPAAESLATIEVVASDLCPRLVARVLIGVSSISSPREMQRRLTLAGMRPINAVVDASNYVMLELGQPTHPYDLDQLSGRGLRVRRATNGESLVTLDGTARTLGRSGHDDLLICDANDRPVGLAGIMGGQSSEISEATADVLLEVASFSSIAIGRTSSSQNLRSEASTRFWRGVDPEGLERAADRFCELVRDAHLAMGIEPPTVAHGRLESAPSRAAHRRISLRVARVNAYLGTELSALDIRRLLEPLGFGIDDNDNAIDGETTGLDAFDVEVPGFRGDVSREVDLIEEVARHFGYDNIASTSRRSPFVGRRSNLQELRRELRRIVTSLGASEAWTSSIVDPAMEQALGSEVNHVQIANPIVVNEVVLRSHLLGGLLQAVRHNVSHRNGDVRLFEIGNVFAHLETDGERPFERELAAVVFAGSGDDAAMAMRAWHALVDGLRLSPEQFDLDQSPGRDDGWLAVGTHPTRSGAVRAASELVAVVGEVDPGILEHLSINQGRVGWLVVDVQALASCRARDAQALPVSHFPSADVDLSFVVPETVPALVIERAIRAAADDLGESVRLVDTYRGRGVDEGFRSLSYRVRFCASDRTLSDADIAAARGAIIDAIESTLPATLRS